VLDVEEVMAGKTSVLEGVMVMLCIEELTVVALGNIHESQTVELEVWIGLTIVEEVLVVFQSPQTELDVVVGMTGLTIVLDVVFGFGHGTHSVVEEAGGVTGLMIVEEVEVWFQTPQAVVDEVWTGATGVDELDVQGTHAVLET
jgi:hypothetical protein